MKILVINLDRHRSRLERISAFLAAAGVPFERMQAVDGRNLTEADLASILRPDTTFALSPSEVACLMSHRAAWRHFLDSGDAFCCVLEDDVRLSADFGPLLAAIAEAGLPDFDVLKIETMRQTIRLDRKRHVFHPPYAVARLRSHHLGTAGYIVGRHGAERLLDLTATMDRPADDMMFDEAALGRDRLKVFQLMPALCIQEDRMGHTLPNAEFASSIDPDRTPLRQPRQKKTRLAKLLREIARPFERLYRLPQRIGTERLAVPFDEARLLKPEALFPVESAVGRG